MLAFLFHSIKVFKSESNENYLFEAISFLTITADVTMKAMIRPNSIDDSYWKKIYVTKYGLGASLTLFKN